jgi:hypothetical protein
MLGPHEVPRARVQGAGEVVLAVLSGGGDSGLYAAARPGETDARIEVDIGVVDEEDLGVGVGGFDSLLNCRKFLCLVRVTPMQRGTRPSPAKLGSPKRSTNRRGMSFSASRQIALVWRATSARSEEFKLFAKKIMECACSRPETRNRKSVECP